MTDLNHALRSVMHEHADDAPPPAGLLDRVHTRRRRARRRRATVLSGALAAVVAAVGISVGVARNDPADDRLQVTAPPAESSAPPSPVDVGWLPAGFGEPRAHLYRPGVWMIRASKAGPHAELSIEIGSAKPPTRTSPGAFRRVAVGGITATLYTVPPHPHNSPPFTRYPEAGGPYAELTFQRTPTQWVRIVAWNGNGAVDMELRDDDLIRIGAGLVDRERATVDLYRFETIPPGLRICANLTLSSASHAQVAFCDARTATTPSADYPRVTEGWTSPRSSVSVDSSHGPARQAMIEALGLDSKPVRAGDRSGVIAKQPDGPSDWRWVGYIEVDDGRTVAVEVPDGKLMTERQFTLFVTGISAGKDLGR
ncbi:hypothetical protein [Cryptosporangium minutisporangium]|uniref:Uncharacterized protein n=1 Tax=Cryptosporangium minutisporangium TaxID=113569 RepID=A0ABP6T3C1_9ACTN